MNSKIKVCYPKLGEAALFAIGLTLAVSSAQNSYANQAPEIIIAPVAALSYRSVFSDYKRLENFTEPKPTAWKLANDKVEKIGGWREYAKEAASPQAPPLAVPSVATPSPAAASPTLPTPKPPAPAMHQHQGKQP